MMTTDLNDLWETVELVRQQVHPDLDAGLLETIVLIEHENLQDDEKALRLIHEALQEALRKRGAK